MRRKYDIQFDVSELWLDEEHQIRLIPHNYCSNKAKTPITSRTSRTMSNSMRARSSRLLAQVVRSSQQTATTTRTVGTATVAKQVGFEGGRHWSNSISFASPEADYTATRRSMATISTQGGIQGDIDQSSWSHSLSFASPESDFTSPETNLYPQDTRAYADADADAKVQDVLPNAAIEEIWSQNMSFASPESDFTAPNLNREEATNGESWSQNMSFTSPESDFTSPSLKDDFINHIEKDESHRSNMAYSLPYSSDDSDFTNPAFMDLLDDRMKEQILKTHPLQQTSLSEKVNRRDLGPLESERHFDSAVAEEVTAAPQSDYHIFHEAPLPHNLLEATLPNDTRAVVITEAQMPFRIISVNDSWEKLCGYTQNQCRGMSLECIQGPETNQSAVASLMAHLLKGEEAGTLLTNYSKDGRKFHNRLRVGPLKNDSGMITHFVGVLKEVNEHGESFDGSMMHA